MGSPTGSMPQPDERLRYWEDGKPRHWDGKPWSPPPAATVGRVVGIQARLSGKPLMAGLVVAVSVVGSTASVLHTDAAATPYDPGPVAKPSIDSRALTGQPVSAPDRVDTPSGLSLGITGLTVTAAGRLDTPAGLHLGSAGDPVAAPGRGGMPPTLSAALTNQPTATPGPVATPTPTATPTATATATLSRSYGRFEG